MRAKVNGVSLHYRLDGPEGAPWLMFSNSLATDLGMWDAEAARFAKSYRVLRYDTRGHGGSDASPAPYDLALLADDARGLIDLVGAKKVAFVGLSLGGMTALGLALKYPERLRGIAVCAARAGLPPNFAALWEPRIRLAREQGMAALIDTTLERWFTEGLRAKNPAFLDNVRQMIRRTSVEGYVGCVGALLGLNYMDRLPQIRLPALFMAGAQDVAAPVDHMQAMHRAVAGSQFLAIDPAGHLFNLEQPETTGRALEQFLAGLPA
jgi:3-oxoadipate enol-lactonase